MVENLYAQFVDTVMKPLFFQNSVFLTYFRSISPFYTPWKNQKLFGFLVFSGGITEFTLVEGGAW